MIFIVPLRGVPRWRGRPRTRGPRLLHPPPPLRGRGGPRSGGGGGRV